MLRSTSLILIGIGSLLVLYGFFPAIFIYPYKPWASSLDAVKFIFLDAPERWYWIAGVMLIVMGTALFRTDKKKKSEKNV